MALNPPTNLTPDRCQEVGLEAGTWNHRDAAADLPATNARDHAAGLASALNGQGMKTTAVIFQGKVQISTAIRRDTRPIVTTLILLKLTATVIMLLKITPTVIILLKITATVIILLKLTATVIPLLKLTEILIKIDRTITTSLSLQPRLTIGLNRS